MKRKYSTGLLVIDHSTVSQADIPRNTSEKKLVMKQYKMSCVCVCVMVGWQTKFAKLMNTCLTSQG